LLELDEEVGLLQLRKIEVKKTYFFCAESSFQWILIVCLFNGV
jgi:hypothetical protein